MNESVISRYNEGQCRRVARPEEIRGEPSEEHFGSVWRADESLTVEEHLIAYLS